MISPFQKGPWVPALLVSLLLSACGGGNDNDTSGSDATNSPPVAAAPAVPQEAGAPAATGDTASDSVSWFNFRRQQMGLPTVTRNPRIDEAALGHSNYQTLNGITHDQVTGKPGFTGVTLLERLGAANYQFTQNSGAYGEVIVRTRNPSGFVGSEDLITAIYHRFVIFEPAFKELGSAAAVSPEGFVYVTTNFVVNGLAPVLGAGNLVTYPFANQQSVPLNFFSDSESPDPIADRNEVGYPISVHADITSTIDVQSFTIRPRGGAPLQVQLLERDTDAHMSRSNVVGAAAIVPLEVLMSGTTYDVEFIGTVDGIPANRSWSFTTR